MRFRQYRFQRWSAGLGLALLMLTQVAFAFAASLSHGVVAGAKQETNTSSSHCQKPGKTNNLCIGHCAIDGQSLDHPLVPVLPCNTLPTFIVRHLRPEPFGHRAEIVVRHATSPPLTILHCSFLI